MEVKKGDTIKVEYTGSLETGEIFDSSQGKPPLEFKAGTGMVIKGFDAAVLGMKKDEEKEITIKPEDAYGPFVDKLQQKFPKDMFGEKVAELKPGMPLMLKHESGKQMMAHVQKIEDDGILLDLNHPLAGKTLIFKVKIVDITEGKPEDSEEKPAEAKEKDSEEK